MARRRGMAPFRAAAGSLIALLRGLAALVGRPGERSQRRKAAWQARRLHLEERLRLAQATEPVRAQAPEACAGRPRAAHGLARGRRQENLAAVGHRADA